MNNTDYYQLYGMASEIFAYAKNEIPIDLSEPDRVQFADAIETQYSRRWGSWATVRCYPVYTPSKRERVGAWDFIENCLCRIHIKTRGLEYVGDIGITGIPSVVDELPNFAPLRLEQVHLDFRCAP